MEALVFESFVALLIMLGGWALVHELRLMQRKS